MATTNFDCNLYFGQLPRNGLNYHVNSCKIEASHPQVRHYPVPVTHEQNAAETHRILISNNTYYGHHHVKPSPPSVEETRLMDCEMMPISSHNTREWPLGRKRSGDDVSFANIKRLKQEDTAKKEMKRCAPKEKDLLLTEELLQGIHGCLMFHILQQQSVL